MTYGKRWMVSVEPRVQRREQKSKNWSQTPNFFLNKFILLALGIEEIGGMCPAGFQNCYEPVILICFLPSPPFKWAYLLFCCSYLTTVSWMLKGTRYYLFTSHIFRSRGDAPKEPHLYPMTSKPQYATIMRWKFWDLRKEANMLYIWKRSELMKATG